MKTSEGIQQQVREAVTNAFVQGLDGREVEKQLARQIGLFPRWANAVDKQYETNLAMFEKQGMSRTDAMEKAQALADKYRGRLIEARANNISRTEIVTASNQGRYISWLQAADAGLIDPATAMKEWVAEADACPDCAEIDTELVGLEEDFSIGELMPPAHPSCRCSAVIVPGEYGPDNEKPDEEKPDEEVPAPAEEDLAPVVEEPSVPESSSSPIDDIRAAIDLIPDWNPSDKLFDGLTVSSGPGELMKEAEGAVRKVGSMVDDEVRSRMQAKGIDGAPAKTAKEYEKIASAFDKANSAERTLYRTLRDEYSQLTGRTYGMNDELEMKKFLVENHPEFAKAVSKAEKAASSFTEVTSNLSRFDSYADELKQVLSEVRAMGPEPRSEINWASDHVYDGRRVGEVLPSYKEMSDKALDFYPRQWIEASNDSGSMFVGNANPLTDRGFCANRSGVGTIHIPDGQIRSLRLYVHEWGHRMEDSVEKIRNMEWTFLDRRAEGKAAKKLSTLTGNKGYRATEKAVKDRFNQVYTGKVYFNAPNANWEILSVGMESIVTNSNGILTRDSDFLHFVIGLLAGV